MEEKKKKKIAIVKNNIAIRIAGKVSRYIDASMNRATPTNLEILNFLLKSPIVLPGLSYNPCRIELASI